MTILSKDHSPLKGNNQGIFKSPDKDNKPDSIKK